MPHISPFSIRHITESDTPVWILSRIKHQWDFQHNIYPFLEAFNALKGNSLVNVFVLWVEFLFIEKICKQIKTQKIQKLS